MCSICNMSTYYQQTFSPEVFHIYIKHHISTNSLVSNWWILENLQNIKSLSHILNILVYSIHPNSIPILLIKDICRFNILGTLYNKRLISFEITDVDLFTASNVA